MVDNAPARKDPANGGRRIKETATSFRVMYDRDSGRVGAEFTRQTRVSEPTTPAIAEAPRRCSNCGAEGHNRRTCSA